jgi:hypothetical protein
VCVRLTALQDEALLQSQKEPHQWVAQGDAAAASVQARRLKIVGQERGDLLLYTYDGPSPSAVRLMSWRCARTSRVPDRGGGHGDPRSRRCG